MHLTVHQKILLLRIVSDNSIQNTPLSFNTTIKTKDSDIYKGRVSHYSGEKIIFLVGCRSSDKETYRVSNIRKDWSDWINPNYINTSETPVLSELDGYKPKEDDYNYNFKTRLRVYSEPSGY